MFDALLQRLTMALLWLRYRLRVTGLDQIADRDHRGILFLPNHPALIDPIIVLALLMPRFRPRALADRRQIDRPVIRWLARHIGVRALADVARDGRDASAQITRLLQQTAAGLARGEALLLYPGGRVSRQRREDLGGNSATEFLLGSTPNVRVVLVRTLGLWGSGFSYAHGRRPSVAQTLRRGIWGLLSSGLLFAPRRAITLEFWEPADLPRAKDRGTINRYLERFYNQQSLPATYVPYSLWERGGPRRMPEPITGREKGATTNIPPATRDLVLRHLGEVTGRADIRDDQRLAHDLELDSLARVELVTWIEAEFGFAHSDTDILETVSDVLLAASGESVGSGAVELRPVARNWYGLRTQPSEQATLPQGDTLNQVFLQAARRSPAQVVVGDQTSGTKTYRDLITAVLVLRGRLEQLPGQYLGIMLPASVASVVVYLAALFAGKTPVMVNWTTGPRNVLHCLDHLGVQHVLTAERLIVRLKSEGWADAQGLFERVVYLEQLAKSLSLSTKLRAAVAARLSWKQLERVRPSPIAAVLFTSGSETQPKAVPLSHGNLLTNSRDLLSVISLRNSEAFLGMLPPFHSFGLTVNILVPLLSGMRAVYYPNPLEARVLASLIEAYQVTTLAGTPTFLAGICRAAQPGQLDSVRWAVTGAEKCPARVYDALAGSCPRALVLEGYGITECSPVVSVNRPERAKRETIGVVLPSLEYAIVEPETGEKVIPGTRGMLLVRGPSVFHGYLEHSGDSCFVEHGGRQWYRTGDLVSEDTDQVLTFQGRLKRFVKLGGEMISLPAIEAVLGQHVAQTTPQRDGPAVAVECSSGQEHTELVLFTSLGLEREEANRVLRDAGLSPLHHIRRVVRLDQLPVLGTGKVDYRALKDLANQH